MISETQKWVWLSRAIGAGSPKPRKLLECLGSIDAIYAAPQGLFELIRNLVNEKEITRLSDKKLDETDKIISACAKKGIRIIVPTDAEYPKRLADIPNPPTVLYAKGERISADDEVAIAIVGTRKFTKNGAEATAKISSEIAAGSGCIVTGLARGVDTIAAETAISVGGKVYGVLGCGIDVYYPPENKKLYEAVQKNGTVISEYPPGTEPSRFNFPRRNRIISGLSLGTVVVEAPEKSGALITAEYALEQNRDVFAVPCGIFEKSGAGTNKLIKEGATPVLCGRDVLEEYAAMHSDKINLDSIPQKTVDSVNYDENKEPEKKECSSEKDNGEGKLREFSFPDGYLEKLSSDERLVAETIGAKELFADEISAVSGLAAAKVMSLLTLLEIRGCVMKLPGGKYAIKNTVR